jgi:hypothetical protein
MLDPRPEPRVTSIDGVEVVEYPRVSRSAVTALLLGLVSVAALVGPLQWILPLAGTVAAVIALRSIARADEPLVGRRAALIGLLLSLLFLTWAPTRYFLRQEILFRQAREHADYWLELVRQGRLYEAHQLTMKKNDRRPPGTDLAEVYENSEDLDESFQGFCGEMPLKKVIQLGSQAQVRFVGRVKIEHDRPLHAVVDIVTFKYAVVPEQGDPSDAVELWIGVARTRGRGSEEASWSIHGVQPPRKSDT